MANEEGRKWQGLFPRSTAALGPGLVGVFADKLGTCQQQWEQKPRWDLTQVQESVLHLETLPVPGPLLRWHSDPHTLWTEPQRLGLRILASGPSSALQPCPSSHLTKAAGIRQVATTMLL